MKWSFVVIFILVIFLAFPQTSVEKTAPINVTATLAFGHTHALRPRGRIGDLQQQTWRITDRLGRTIGAWMVICRWMREQQRYCDTDMILPRGQIIASGTSPTQYEGEFAVTGGTGLYQGGGGVLAFTAIGLSKNSIHVIITT